ncbi:MAG: flavin prenyltransferase UbiX [Gemmatimonadota bacterium]
MDEVPQLESPLVVGVTGASGAPYAVRLIRALVENQVPTSLIISSHGWRLFSLEVGVESESGLRELLAGDWSRIRVFDNRDRGAEPASGSAPTRGMVVCPCSMGTLAAIAGGHSRSLIERAADVTLKERRPLVLVPRETPLSEVHLRNMLAVTQAGAVVLPAAPGFYGSPKSIDDLVDFVVARILSHVGLRQQLGPRWTGE